MQVVFHDDFYQVYTSDPAAAAGRMEAIVAVIEPEVEFVEAAPATEAEIALAHTKSHIKYIRQSGLYDISALAAGAAIQAAEIGLTAPSFGLIRPPGHHALKNKAMGFCIFNKVAIGARYIQKKHNLSDILIVDWDVHHGNGTQAMFYDDPSVLYFSTHQYPFYPGTGSEMEKGSDKGINHTINVPMPIGSGDSEYLRAFKEKLEPAALAFSPDFVLISAGFDAHKDDLLGGMKLTAEGFAQLTQIVKEISEKCCEGRLVSVLEGGYGLDGLAASVEAHIRVLMR